MQLALFLTGRCNAQCTHCTTDSSPHKRGALPTPTLFQLMDQAAALNESGETLYFYLTGGEAFLDFDRLVQVTEYGTRLGGRVTVTSNCFWASEDGKARRMLEAVRDAGLYALGASTSRYHQQYVNPDRVRRALTIARELGIQTVLKCAITASDREDGWAERFADSVKTDEREIFPVVPYLRQGAVLADEEYMRKPGLPEGVCPAALLTVREDGRAYTCCNPGGFADLLCLGDVHQSGIAELRNRHVLNGVQRVLIEQGPIGFARAAVARGHGERLRAAYEGVCDLCGHIAADPILSGIAADTGEAVERRRLETIFRTLLDAAPN